MSLHSPSTFRPLLVTSIECMLRRMGDRFITYNINGPDNDELLKETR